MAAKKSSTNVVPFAVTEWPADRVEKWPLEKIKPYPNNPRTHPPEQIALLAASMMDDGVTMPILVDEQGIIIAGHGRHLAAQQNKFHDYPVVIARGWSETKKRASRVRDNQMGLLSRWDDILLRAEVGELKVEDYDLKLLGFGDGELYALSLDIERGEADPLLEWSGMPEFDQQNKQAFRTLIVHFKTQEAIKEFEKKLGITVGDVRYIYYPLADVDTESMVDKRYKAK